MPGSARTSEDQVLPSTTSFLDRSCWASAAHGLLAHVHASLLMAAKPQHEPKGHDAAVPELANLPDQGQMSAEAECTRMTLD